MLIVAALCVAGGNAHAFADHAAPRVEPCEAHSHHEPGDRHSQGAAGHQQCCCSCFSCPVSLITPFEGSTARPVAYASRLTPSKAAPLANRFSPPELDPPRPSALS